MLNFRTVRFSNLLAMGLLIFATACTSKQNAGSKTNPVQGLPDDTVIIEYEGGKVTAKDIAPMMGQRIKRAQSDLLDAYKQNAQQMAVQRLVEAEAKKQGLGNPEELIAKNSLPDPVTSEAVDKLYKEQNLAKGVKDPRSGQVQKISKEQVKSYMEEQSRREKAQAYVQTLVGKAKIRTALEEQRINVPVNPGSPMKGSKSAKVVIHEFSDFQCPFCSQAAKTVSQINAAYGDKVVFYFRHLPLPNHPRAMPAAIASGCAQKQGKFWEYHDKVFAEMDKMQGEKWTDAVGFNTWAKEIGIDTKQFDECFAKQESKSIIDQDKKDMENLDVGSTPTFFVNGKKVEGALPFEAFKNMIDEELAKK